jgi:hypothetical protein
MLAGKEVQEVRLDRDESWDSSQEYMSELLMWRQHVRKDPADAEKNCLV